jgi:hypothetical protein
MFWEMALLQSSGKNTHSVGSNRRSQSKDWDQPLILDPTEWALSPNVERTGNAMYLFSNIE